MADLLQGIIEIQLALKKMAERSEREITQMVDDVTEAVHARYVKNLSGPVPSTATKPLPVGVRTGNLRAGVLCIKDTSRVSVNLTPMQISVTIPLNFPHSLSLAVRREW